MSGAEEPAANWADRLRSGDPTAAQELWDLYFDRMVALARKKLRGLSGRASDEEDVALSAFKSFCRAVEGGRQNEALAPDSLWSLMMVLTVRKAIKLWRYESRVKRRRPEGDAAAEEYALRDAKGREPDPGLIACMAEECERLLRKLGDPVLRTIALRKMEGYTNAEIAGELDLTVRTVERKVQVIRERLEDES